MIRLYNKFTTNRSNGVWVTYRSLYQYYHPRARANLGA